MMLILTFLSPEENVKNEIVIYVQLRYNSYN